MHLLALDTSTGPASAALLRQDGTVVTSHADDQPMRQSQRLVADVDAMMRAQGGYEQVNAIAVTTGPGGFTGIRVALAAARGLALACDVPLLGISSLETFAWQALHNTSAGATAVAVVNAFRNQAYVQAFHRTDTAMQPLCEAQAVDMAALPDFLAAYPDAHKLGNVQQESAGYQAHPAPQARYTGLYALALLAQNHDEAIATHPAEAHYIRPPDAKPQKPLFPA